MKKAIFSALFMGGFFAGQAFGADSPKPEAPKPITAERIQELLKKLEEPTRRMSDTAEGPPDYAWMPFDYRWHLEEMAEFKLAGNAPIPSLLTLLADRTKPGQARAHAAAILAERLVGTKVQPDAKILAALKVALRDKDPVLRFGILVWVDTYGLAMNLDLWAMHKKTGSDEYTKRWLPPEERSFTPEVMDALLPQIVAVIADEEPRIACAAIKTIEYFGRPKTGVAELIAALKRKEIVVCIASARTLSHIGKDDDAALKAVLGELDPEKYGDRYASILASIGGFGSKAKSAVPILLAAIKNNGSEKITPSMYHSVIYALGAIGPDAKEAVPLLLEYAESGASLNNHASEVVEALEKIDTEAGKKGRAIKKRHEDEFKRWIEEKTRPIELPPLITPVKR